MSTQFDPIRFRPLFIVAAIWNLAAASVALIAPSFHTETFFGPGTTLDDPVAFLNTQMVWVTVGLFGIGYWIVARDPRKNHGIVLLAILGKVYVSVAWCWAWTADIVAPFALAGATGDLLFAAAFAFFLLKARVVPAEAAA